MCGIIGEISKNKIASSTNFFDAQNMLEHRGPDNQSFTEIAIDQYFVKLGHTRLSIINLSTDANQPMMSKCGKSWIIFNGEIYNYREIASELKAHGVDLVGDSDTEVLLEAWNYWGKECLIKMKGMFAFIICNIEDKKIFLVRDGFGIKPIFYTVKKNAIYFASEAPALIKLSGDEAYVCPQTAYEYLVYAEYDHSEQSFFKNIKYVKPGHFLEVDISEQIKIKEHQWWMPSIKENNDISFNEAAEKLREMFLDNIRLHLRSDVPIGAALSGGIDSSAVVCAIRYLEPQMDLHTFSYISNDVDISEQKWIDIVNDHVGAIPHKLSFENAELFDDIEDLVRGQGEPFGSTSIYAQYRISKAVKEAGITVLLNGQGADELLAGYDGYPQFYMKSLIDKAEYFRLLTFINNWKDWPNRSLKKIILLLGELVTPSWLRPKIRELMGQKKLPSYIDLVYIKNNHVKTGFNQINNFCNAGKGRRLVERLRDVQMGNGLAQQLRDGDRDSMRWSIESRVPFLTIDMAEFLLSLPEHYLISDGGETKSIFKAAMRGIVPDVILDRKDKIGFQTPENDLLFSNLSRVRQLMNDSGPIPLVNKVKMISLIDDFASGNFPLGPKVWRLLNYAMWCKKFKVS
jgi:asparagine synthase (glutamine-hydrolysing)